MTLREGRPPTSDLQKAVDDLVSLRSWIEQEVTKAEAAGYPKCASCGVQLGPHWRDLPTLDDEPVCERCARREIE